MLELDREQAEDFIRDIDLMARVAYTWVRQQAFGKRFQGLPLSAAEECELAAGFVAGMKARLQLEDTETTMVAYIYALMAGERGNAVYTASEIVRQRSVLTMTSPAANGYQQGLNAARELLDERLGSAASEPVTGFSRAPALN